MIKKIMCCCIFFLCCYAKFYATSDFINEAFVIENLANTRNNILEENDKEAYINSKIALILVQNAEMFNEVDHFIALFNHVIACDRIKQDCERDEALYYLKEITKESNFTFDDQMNSFEQYSETYEELIDFTKSCVNQTTKDKLVSFVNIIFTKNNFSEANSANDIFIRKACYKRSLKWWREEISKKIDDIIEWIEFAKKVKGAGEALYNLIND